MKRDQRSISCADGYYETFRFEKAMEETTLVAYEMNGEPLPRRQTAFPYA